MSFAASLTREPIAFDPSRGADVAAFYGDFAPEVKSLIKGTAGCSPFLAGLLEREQDWLKLALSGDPLQAFGEEIARLNEVALEVLDVELRRAKRRVALLAALCDLGGAWSLERVTWALTLLADTAVTVSLKRLVADEIRRNKLPGKTADDAETAAGMVALAMGKMGAYELNYSSDIDLICLFDETQFAPDDRMEARSAFIRVTRKMAAMLNDNTAEGYVFRTDLRLRPDASVTPVCISMGAAELYYEAEGRTWERAAYIKARPCGGDLAAGERFLKTLIPFVWRKHLDFAAIEDAHDMRLRIRAHKGLGGRIDVPGHNMKLGQGGIREIEFFTQTRQLIAGGRDPELRDRTTVGGLAKLAVKGWVPTDVARELTDHYREHREIEHRIQMVNDSQTQLLPNAEEGLTRIANMMGEGDLAAWSARLKGRLERVEALTGAFFAPGAETARPELSETEAGIVEGWRAYPALRSERAQGIFRRIEPEILGRMRRAACPEEALRQFDGFLARLPAGVQLFALFEANPQLIDLIVDICATAPGLAAHLSRNAGVLDAVLGGSFFEAWPGQAKLQEDLAALLFATADYEKKLDAARRWAKEMRFRVGVHHLRGLVDASEAAKHYADIAGAAVAALWPQVGAEFARKHGPAPGRGAVVLGMGSLGAERLNAASDLDLIIIYDAQGAESSDGPKSLATRPYFARLTQAFITALTAPTPEGRLYEVDMRLRPSGRQGPVAVSLESFRAYQMDEAWTWEHLALTRARVLVGDSGLGADVEAVRQEVLAAKGSAEKVMPDLAQMRARIFAAKAPDGAWEAKIGPGRLQDIELLAQSFALRAGESARRVEPQLRLGPRHNFITKEEGEVLAAAYRFLWRLQAGGRLLTDRPLDMEAIGEGGRAFLLREVDEDSLETLVERLERTTSQAAQIVERALN
ncbi:glutamate-ammonia-ligase adenylyltransferase [Rhodobacter aestuarii]|uniref:Glutamate-ammonia-ligase adenylyltransferase n=1 Tax=Rhodobacter aestuarii TaxID=453582 RepID=A0A1N7MS68_9RHOB|nr:glutamine-synthetase adenylyltransferase [Rhodobacter aestuarii]PTV96570.1 glutamate-ammonia-ligase adenylyltransferase [Rhodobacter aestuarii]SIS88973.1 glutamate-ammonia-ligase adenylyltransferase [Rhodobacter aestuarii]